MKISPRGRSKVLRPTTRFLAATGATLFAAILVGYVGVQIADRAPTQPGIPAFAERAASARLDAHPGVPGRLERGALRGYNLLIITVDTLRADALSVYGGRRVKTTHLDRLANEGVRFDAAFAHAPMTLPSHASLLTGTYPFRHGVRDNGFRLDESRLTLAEVLHGNGYRTGAFVGAFVLDVRFGLGQGFDHYDDYYRENPDPDDFRLEERQAPQVLAPATSWIEGGEGPWLAWVHLFDPHAPYEPPEAYLRGRRDEPYYGEVAYIDDELGRFLEGLRGSGSLDDTLVVFTADHGESLGDHGEQTHGAFAYNATLRVPLIIWSGGRLQPGVVGTPVGLVDVAPTVLELLGVSVPDTMQGEGLLSSGPEGDDDAGGRSERQASNLKAGGGSIGGGGTRGRPIYFEALNGYLTQNLAPLTGLVEGDYKYIDLPIPELYHLPTDPREQDNLAPTRPETTARYRAWLEQQLGVSATPRGQSPVLAGLRGTAITALDAANRGRLAALGYLTATAVPAERVFTVADDPKNAIELIEKQRSAWVEHAYGRSEEAIRRLREVIAERPQFIIAYVDLASILYATGRTQEAISALEAALAEEPTNVPAASKLGLYTALSGDSARAGRLLEDALERAPHDVEVMTALAITYSSMDRQAQARALLVRVIEMDPSSASAHNNLGLIYLREGDYARAIEHFGGAIERAPGLWNAHQGLASAFALTDRYAEAVEEWKRLVELNPHNLDGLYNLGMVLSDLGREQEALLYLDRFTNEAPPDAVGMLNARRVGARIRSGGGSK